MKKMILTLLVALPMSVFAQKFGHFNSADIIQYMPEYAAAQSKLNAQAKVYEDRLQEMQDELKLKADAYDKEKATMTDTQKQEREKELTAKNEIMQNYYQQSQKELEKAQQEERSKLSDKINQAIEEIGKTGGFVYIMDTTAGIPYISKTLSVDVTEQLKKKLGVK
jgi:outer membrane protein